MKVYKPIYGYAFQNKFQKGAKPKFGVRHQIGEFTIIDYIGYSTVHPGTAKILSREHHWYRCKCSCGLLEIRTQQQLIDKRREQKCTICLLPKTEVREINDHSSERN
jgi:hypothetical protein